MTDLTPEQVDRAMKILSVDDRDLADEFDVSERTVRRWREGGARGKNAVGIIAMLQLVQAGIAWRKGHYTIKIYEDGFMRLIPGPR